MQCSHSRIESFESCPFKYKLRYCDKILTLPPDDAANALVLGTALHAGLEKGVDTAIEQYFTAYPVITDEHIDEAMKLESLIPKAAALIPKGKFEVKVSNDDFVGYLDLLVPVDGQEGVYDLYDFKYSNNTSKYRQSVQLHLYKHYFELLNPGKSIRNMYFLVVPKVKIKKGKKEDLFQFRKRIQSELNKAEPQLIPIEFDYHKVTEYMTGVKRTLETTEFPKNQSYLCNWCEYQLYCEKGIDYMLLPKNERRNIEKVEKKVLWLYGSPFSGKTTFANNFPDPLMLNTDGNIKFVDAPFIPIKDEVKVEGRMTKRTLAWEVFKDAVAELEKKENEFKTIIVDLLEDCYEHCRLYMYGQMGITHESDDSFRAWDKVRTEFLSTLKRLMNLNYENIILISHEDTSKDITKKGGDKITSIKPNLQEKTANKVAGMVDIVARVIADGDVRTLSFKTSEVIFGGGRLTSSINEIPLDFGAFLTVYEEANNNAVAALKGKKTAAQTASAPETGKHSSIRAKKETPPTPPSSDEPETPPVEDEKEFFSETTDESTESASNDDGSEADGTGTDTSSDSTEDAEQPKEESKPATVKTRKRRGE